MGKGAGCVSGEAISIFVIVDAGYGFAPFVNDTVTVVVNTVANFDSSGIDRRVAVVAIFVSGIAVFVAVDRFSCQG